MQAFLSVLLWIFIIIVAIILLLLFLPVCVAVKYDYDELTVKLKILFLSFTLYPMKEKEQEEKDAQEEPPQSPQPKKKQKAKFPDFEKLAGLVSTAGMAMKIIFKGIYFTKATIIYPVHCEDAADTAINYGKTHAYLGAAIATLRNYLHISFKELNIIPDFTGEYKYRRYFYCNIWGTPFIIVVAGIYAFKRILKEKLIPMKPKQKNNQSKQQTKNGG
ncbi:MAG: DUF2953 domain-containing protein [Oscillospiraceae bacterium]